MIVLYTDFGNGSPYVGQMKAVLAQNAPAVPVIDLMHDAPVFDSQASSYLLAALIKSFPADTIFLCVVDPGVGGQRDPLLVRAGGQWFVGPDNGLFNVISAQAQETGQLEWKRISWRPERLSHSFHGRDLFAPVAAQLAKGEMVPGDIVEPKIQEFSNWPPDLKKIIYIDHFGNAFTGIRASAITSNQVIIANGFRFNWARTFSDVNLGEGFWYENANGLVEIAVNQERADVKYNLGVGDEVHIVVH